MSAHGSEPFQALEVRVRGCVQGVGFRPTIWHIARELGLAGEVLNDSEGVLLRVGGDQARLSLFLQDIERRLPPLARPGRPGPGRPGWGWRARSPPSSCSRPSPVSRLWSP